MDLELSMGLEFSYEVLHLMSMCEICLEIMLILGSHVGKNLHLKVMQNYTTNMSRK